MRPNGTCVGLRPARLTGWRGLCYASAHRGMRAVPARAANAASNRRFLRGLADRCASPVAIDLESPAGAYRIRGAEELAPGTAQRLAGARLGRSRARDLLQAARERS